MNTLGVGVDLVEVARVSTIIADKGSRVFQRLLTPGERAYCESRPDPATHVAVRLAAKEAVYKALQGSDAARGIGWREIEVTRAPDGRPDVILSGAKAGVEIGEILGGTKAAPPAGATVVFKSLGQAVEDACAARLVYDAAIAEQR